MRRCSRALGLLRAHLRALLQLKVRQLRVRQLKVRPRKQRDKQQDNPLLQPETLLQVEESKSYRGKYSQGLV